MATTRGDRLRIARERRFRSARQAAKAIGMAPSTYGAHERAEDPGGRDYGPNEAKRYARRFGVSTEWLLIGKGKGPDEAGPEEPEPETPPAQPEPAPPAPEKPAQREPSPPAPATRTPQAEKPAPARTQPAEEEEEGGKPEKARRFHWCGHFNVPSAAGGPSDPFERCCPSPEAGPAPIICRASRSPNPQHRTISESISY